jgi:hypothetical protein
MSVLLTPTGTSAQTGAPRAVSPVGQGSAPVRSQTVIRCGRCGGSRPVGHAHCYACGARLTGRGEKRGRRVGLPSWSGVRSWAGWAKVGAAARLFTRRPRITGFDGRTVEFRTWGDRAARWYVALSVVGVAAWFVAGPAVILPVRADSAGGAGVVSVGPSEACAWMDGQRVQLMGEAGRLTETQRGELARRLGELAAAVGRG